MQNMAIVFLLISHNPKKKCVVAIAKYNIAMVTEKFLLSDTG
jgi:hypothetical protein